MHISRQEADVRAFMEDESLVLDPGLDYSAVAGLSLEVIEKLSIVRPTTIVSFYVYPKIRLVFDFCDGCRVLQRG